MKTVTVFPSFNRPAAVYNSDEFSGEGYTGLRLFVGGSVRGGVSTIDAKVQIKDELSGAWLDLTGAAVTQVTTVGTGVLTIYPGLPTAAGVTVNNVLGGIWRVVMTVGGSTYTCSCSAVVF